MHHYELFLLCFVLFLKQGLAVSASTVLALTIESRLACSFCYSPVSCVLGLQVTVITFAAAAVVLETWFSPGSLKLTCVARDEFHTLLLHAPELG